MARYQRPVLNFNANDVWGAASAAQRINNAYLKSIPVDENYQPVEGVQTNRQIIDTFLANPDLISQADREEGENIRTYYKGLTFKILQGIKLNDFDNTAMTIANRDTIDSMYDVAVIASLPSCYIRAKARDDANARVRDADGGFISSLGNKVTLDIEVVKCIYSRNYNTYFVTGITDKNQAVFFSYKDGMNAGKRVKVAGTVKAHRDDSTQLNRVKVI
jgi:hypothetical protein